MPQHYSCNRWGTDIDHYFFWVYDRANEWQNIVSVEAIAAMYRRGLDEIIPKSDVYNACYLRDLEKLKTAISKPGGLDDVKTFVDPITNKTPLYVASEDACPDCALLLLENGAPIDAVGPRMRTPLMAAASFKRVDLIELLCERVLTLISRTMRAKVHYFMHALLAAYHPCALCTRQVQILT